MNPFPLVCENSPSSFYSHGGVYEDFSPSLETAAVLPYPPFFFPPKFSMGAVSVGEGGGGEFFIYFTAGGGGGKGKGGEEG